MGIILTELGLAIAATDTQCDRTLISSFALVKLEIVIVCDHEPEYEAGNHVSG